MFRFLRNLRRKQAEPAAAIAAVSDETEIISATTEAPISQPQAFAPAPRSAAPVANGRTVVLPLQPILAGLPLELQPRVLHPDVGEMTVAVPLEKVLSQLTRGAVKISFGELRVAARGVFNPAADRDRVLVSLPLADVLARLNPALIARRRAQKSVEVPAEVTSPFEAQPESVEEDLVFSMASNEPVAPEPPTFHSRIPANPPLPPSPIRPAIKSAPAPAPPAPAPLPEQPISMPGRSIRQPGGNGTPAAPPAHAFPFSAKPAPQTPPAQTVRPQPAPPAPAPAAPALETVSLLIGLTALAETWPEAVRKEIVQLSLVDAKVGLPMEAIERALKQGRIAFTWKMIRSWIKPAPAPAVSVHDGAILELPLKVVAPLFLNRQKEINPPQPKIAIDEQIPNLFFGFPQSENGQGAAPAAGQKDTNYYVWDDTSETAKVDASEYKRPPTTATELLRRGYSPNEVVAQAASLEGVNGALIALPDGLMVASRLPADSNGDTLAAFLPQIFGKVSQCTKELRMGELNNLNFTVGNVPWKIFRVNAIFFAAFGCAGESLPTAQLSALAAELDRKQK